MDGSFVSSSSSTSAPIERWTYDVFLSFRGEDTRKNFVDHLYAALDQAGIYTFKDDERLQRGKSISPELARAIQESMIAVVVFSKNYANSSWCLEELAKIIECRDLMGQMVLPVFYDVDPLDVRGQKRSFHVAFEQHEVKLIDNMEKVKSWREALKTAANLSGWDVPKTATGHEAECIKQIVRNILSYTESRPAENLIGMGSQVRNVKSLLGKMFGDVRIIGIWGMGGIGKTTIARAVYRQISYEFDGSCFVEDVRENGSDNKGLKSLQEKLLSEILMQEHFKVKDCHDGICQIRRRLSRKKVLIVLDDVDNIKQIEFLAGGREWFGLGSRILVTTRDEHLLCYAQEKYAPELLKDTEAMKLFSKYANNPPKAYEKLSGLVVSHTGHLPLALKVLGSHFCGRSLEFWQSALNVLAKIPHKEINGILKLSFDGLNILEKKIFLYIACFFKGWDRFYVTRVLDSFGFEAISGITVLIEKSLLTISKRHLHMHDLIQEMGRCIVSDCYPNTLVWVAEEIQEVMTTVTRLEAVEAIVEPENDNDSETSIACCSAEVFKSMKKLKLLQVRGLLTLSEPTYFPEELRWLCWSFYPFESLRITAGMTKLVGLEMRRSQMKQLQIEKTVILTNLKLMDLNRSYSVTSFPDISGVPNLERLYLSYCDSLVEVHQSVLLHERIIHLDLCGCVSLEILPPSIQMKSLQTLLLDNCMSLKKFPEVAKEMEKLLVLRLDGCDKLGTLPPSIGLLTGLIVLTMEKRYFLNYLEQELEEGLSKRTLPNNLRIQGCTQLSSLRILDLKNNDLVENDFPGDVHNAWSSLEELNLSENNFTRLPATISHFSHLKYLDLRNCINLEELDELPSRIQVLKADRCTSLEKIRDLSNKYKWLFKISVTGCPKLLMDQESQSQVANLLMKSLVQNCAAVNHRLSISVPGSKMPNWFSNRRFGDKITLDLPENQIPKMKGLAICCLFCSPMNMDTFLKIKFKPSGEEKLIELPASAAENADFVWIGYMSIDLVRNLCYGFDSEDLIISLEPCFNDIVECGVCPVYKDEIQPMTGIGSRIPDYDELGWLDVDSASREDLQHRRLSLSTFFFGHEKTGDHNTVQVVF